MTTRTIPDNRAARPRLRTAWASLAWLGVPALRPGGATDTVYGAAPRRPAHEGSPPPGPRSLTMAPDRGPRDSALERPPLRGGICGRWRLTPDRTGAASGVAQSVRCMCIRRISNFTTLTRGHGPGREGRRSLPGPWETPAGAQAGEPTSRWGVGTRLVARGKSRPGSAAAVRERDGEQSWSSKLC